MVLREFGLSEAAERAYSFVATHKGATRAEICKLLQSEQQAEQACAELSGAGLVIPSWECDDGIAILDPEVTLERLLAARAAELATQQEQLAAARAAAAAFTRDLVKEEQARNQHEDPAPSYSLIEHQGVDAVWRALDQAYESATQEILALYPPNALMANQVERAVEMDARALGRGVSVRQVHGIARAERRHSVRHREGSAAAGAEVRQAKQVPTQMLLVDRRLAILTSVTDAKQVAVELHCDVVLVCLDRAFELIWEAASPVEGPAATGEAADDDGLSGADLALLRLLAVGMKDEVAARRLGVSVRTFRRQVAGLMEVLNTVSRFQLGAYAASRGWLELPSRQLRPKPVPGTSATPAGDAVPVPAVRSADDLPRGTVYPVAHRFRPDRQPACGPALTGPPAGVRG